MITSRCWIWIRWRRPTGSGSGDPPGTVCRHAVPLAALSRAGAGALAALHRRILRACPARLAAPAPHPVRRRGPARGRRLLPAAGAALARGRRRTGGSGQRRSGGEGVVRLSVLGGGSIVSSCYRGLVISV